MPEYFKQYSYIVLGGGKSYHPGLPPNYDEPRSWTQEMPYLPFTDEGCKNVKAIGGHTCPDPSTPDTEYFDYKVTNNSIKAMATAQGLGKKFFVVCGYRRPHIPWHMPKRFFDLYADSATGHPIALSAHQDIGMNVSTLGYTQCGFASPVTYNGSKIEYGPHKPLPVSLQRVYRQGYYGSVSWLDSQVGRLMDAVDAMGLAPSTVVALWGDHVSELPLHTCSLDQMPV